MSNFKFRKTSFIFTLLIAGCISSHSHASAYSSHEKLPYVYSVYQQQGPTCPFIPWVNLNLIKDIRQKGEGKIDLQNGPAFTKLQSYARFLPQIIIYDSAMDALRQKEDGAYHAYETELRAKGIHDNARFNSNGKPIEKLDLNPLNKARRLDYTPYNIKHVEVYYSPRWLPIIHNPEDDEIYFYHYKKDEKQKLPKAESFDQEGKTLYKISACGENLSSDSLYGYRFTNEQIGLMGFTPEQFKELEVQYGRTLLGSQTGYYAFNSTSKQYCEEIFYDVGSYQHLLFALGLDKNNRDFDESSDAYQAHQEFKEAMDANPLNPLANVKKEDFFEYHLANIFLKNNELKEKAKVVLSKSLNKTWSFYQKSFTYFDSNDKKTRTQFTDKQDFLPGEEQMLAYFFSKEMSCIWASTIGDDALVATSEIDQEIGPTMISFIKLFKNSKTLIQDANKKVTIAGIGKLSLLDVWQDVLSDFSAIRHDFLEGQEDFVTFSGHGCVISFDEDLISLQTHQHPETGKKIGFTLWDQLYDKALNPFYRFKGESKPLSIPSEEEDGIFE